MDADAFEVQAGKAAAARLLDQFPGVTAVIAGEIQFALGLMEELRSRGLSAPQDVSIVCFRDDPALSKLREPVAAITLPELSIAREAISRLVQRINGSREYGRRVLIQPELVRPEAIAEPPLKS